MNPTYLDPETCIALKPILDDGKRAMDQLDAANSWTVGIANILGVSLADFSSEEIPKQYAELRGRITEVVKILKA
jgi:hypothetical protein